MSDSEDVKTHVQQLFLLFLLFSSGKPPGDRPVRLPAQVLHDTLQDWELTEIHGRHRSTSQPVYCHGVFDAITMGE